MREPERDPGRLNDIITASNHIADFTRGLSEEELYSDKLRYFAVVKNVEIGMSLCTDMRPYSRNFFGIPLWSMCQY